MVWKILFEEGDGSISVLSVGGRGRQSAKERVRARDEAREWSAHIRARFWRERASVACGQVLVVVFVVVSIRFRFRVTSFHFLHLEIDSCISFFWGGGLG